MCSQDLPTQQLLLERVMGQTCSQGACSTSSNKADNGINRPVPHENVHFVEKIRKGLAKELHRTADEPGPVELLKVESQGSV